MCALLRRSGKEQHLVHGRQSKLKEIQVSKRGKPKAASTNSTEPTEIEVMYQKAVEAKRKQCHDDIQAALEKYRFTILTGFVANNGFIPSEQIMKLTPAWVLSPKG
jgi:hypothetical protein